MYLQLLEKTEGVELFDSLQSIRKKYLEGGLVPEEVYKMYEDGDHTPKKKYLQWMLKQYVEDPSRPEHILDLVKAYDDLIVRRLVTNTDIYRYRTWGELEQEILQATEETERERDLGKLSSRKGEDAEVILDNEDFLIVKPSTLKGSSPWGQGIKQGGDDDKKKSSRNEPIPGYKAEWCTTASYGWDGHYVKNGELFYYIYDKKTGLKWCIQVYPQRWSSEDEVRRRAWNQLDNSMSMEDFHEKTNWPERARKYGIE
jgi:hypothetical protein